MYMFWKIYVNFLLNISPQKHLFDIDSFKRTLYEFCRKNFEGQIEI